MQSYFSSQLLCNDRIYSSVLLSRWNIFTGMMIGNSTRLVFSERNDNVILPTTTLTVIVKLTNSVQTIMPPKCKVHSRNDSSKSYDKGC